MNERIQDLLLKVVPMSGEDGEYLPSLHTPQDIEKFAELIVQECAEVAGCNAHVSGFSLGDLIKQHFGVEE